LEVMGLPAERCMIIGDSLVSDIALGKNAGMMTTLVLTGSVNREAAEASNVKPDLIWNSIADLRDFLESEQVK